ncbi:coiled-coil domain-containing protein 103 [Osmerus eperlanus]|uniref:coiled-coil domain-containing protein 103 n=1 Tax=Osmerus eperlanus TaxID=29151 RepID=UPI002E158AEC
MSEEIVNFSALERELQGALEADRKYQRENDAKFRALHQKVGSYEEFRDIVQASHLRPLDKKDKAGGPRKQPWNSLASSFSSSSSSSFSSSSTDTPRQQHECSLPLPQPLPRTTSELSRCWRQLAGACRGRYRLLLALGGPALRDIFRAEVGFGLLGEFLVVLCEGLQPGDEGRVTEVLEGLTQTPRFSLNLALLSPSERGRCETLLPLLATAAQRGRGERGRSGDVGGDGGEEKGREGEEGDIDDAEEQGGNAQYHCDTAAIHRKNPD